ncbi:MAG: hypothetical protein ACD_24C00370G0001 [uncultured bacterium]|nr:MAG: hypothetical protein ACD_24C00370G0001 [uncultured bacterium]
MKSYFKLSRFLAAFFGRRTVKIEREISEKTFEILSAREYIPTSEKLPVILAMLLDIADHPSFINREIPAGMLFLIKLRASLLFIFIFLTSFIKSL